MSMTYADLSRGFNQSAIRDRSDPSKPEYLLTEDFQRAVVNAIADMRNKGDDFAIINLGFYALPERDQPLVDKLFERIKEKLGTHAVGNMELTSRPGEKPVLLIDTKPGGDFRRKFEIDSYRP